MDSWRDRWMSDGGIKEYRVCKVVILVAGTGAVWYQRAADRLMWERNGTVSSDTKSTPR